MSDTLAERRFETPFGTFALHRYPSRAREALQAWCAADSLLLEAIARREDRREAILVVNDEHGALAIPPGAAASWSDSALSDRALARNLQRNQRPPIPVIPSTQAPPSDCSLVAMRVPKQLAYFEYQLATLAATAPRGTPLLLAGMDKHLSPNTAELIERYVGPTERHRGQRKARVFEAVIDGARESCPVWAGYHCQPLGAELRAMANVFSRDGLDQGSAFLLSHLRALAPAERTIDLACGNGVLGLAALAAGITREVVFCDESAMAVASAADNLARLRPQDAARCSVLQGDGLRDYAGPPADLVLCNPPFHLQHVVDDFAGRRLLSQVAAHLAEGGQLCLVANRHLKYRPALERNFRRVSQLGQNRKFIVWLASEPRHPSA